MMRRCLSALLAALCLAAGPRDAAAQGSATALPQDLKKLTLEELAQIDVTSASRRPERLSAVPAAVSVVRRDDIVRSGTTVLAEAMRLGDAVDVARVNGNTWAVSMRGFNISTANKILVLVDGRSTYSPLFSGTFWDVQDTIVADLDRIEFIRGPGGATWGANAMNGVINIISRPAAETVGAVVTVLAGTNEMPLVSGRHGDRLGSGHYRVFGKYRKRDSQVTSTGDSANDAVQFGQAGFRFDSDQSRRTRWTLSGAAYLGGMELRDRPDGEVSGGHLLLKWNRRTASHGQFEVRGYYDRTNRFIPMQFEEHRNAGDIDGQHEFRVGRHAVVSGAQLHFSRGTDVGTAGFFFEPEEKSHWLTTIFVQDQIELARDRAYVIAGTKIVANNYTGAEILPTIRVRLQPNARHMAWGAISRAVRLPTRFDTELRLRNPAGIVTITGTEAFKSESVIAYEAGYRAQPHPRVLADISVFANRYGSLRSQELRFVPVPRIFLENGLDANSHGVEAAATLQALPNWRLHGSYAWLKKTLSFHPASTDPTKGVFEANDPSHLASLRSQLDLPAGFALDGFLRYVGERRAVPVPAYTELDLRLGWRVNPYWELSLVGQNLLHDRHAEFNFTPVIEFRRAAYLRSVWDF